MRLPIGLPCLVIYCFKNNIIILKGDLGDHVVVVNTKHISMPDRFWRGWRHFSHKGYAGSFKSERAWQVHRQDPTEVKHKIKYIYLYIV